MLIDPSLANARRVLAALECLPRGVARELAPAVVAAMSITIIGDDPRVDLLTLAWSVRDADAAPKTLRVEIEGIEIPFVDLDTLIRTKQTGQFQDLADVESLEMVRRAAPEQAPGGGVPPIAGKFASNTPDTASRVDDLLWRDPPP